MEICTPFECAWMIGRLSLGTCFALKIKTDDYNHLSAIVRDMATLHTSWLNYTF